MEKEKKKISEVEDALNSWLKPEVFAQKWDKVGMLFSPNSVSVEGDEIPAFVSSIMICTDLTVQVMKEAISLNIDLIITYHPPTSFASKAKCSLREGLLKTCLEHGISIYSPHTTLDTIVGGINDRILTFLEKLHPEDAIEAKAITPELLDERFNGVRYLSTRKSISTLYAEISNYKDLTVSIDVRDVLTDKSDQVSFSVFLLKNGNSTHLQKCDEAAKSLNITKLGANPPAFSVTLGAGRIVSFSKSVMLEDVIQALKECMGISSVLVSAPSYNSILKIAVCVGSGAAFLKGLEVDVVITGEMSHRDLLHFSEAGQTVILCGHAESEKHYWPTLAEIVKIITGVEQVHVTQFEKTHLRSM